MMRENQINLDKIKSLEMPHGLHIYNNERLED